jgi:4-amino-4-deoxy-L-arabinose transferase-like glycosyltransferase
MVRWSSEVPPMNAALPHVAWIPLLGLVAAKVVVHGAFTGDYGFHRDELYYLMCGRALDWGYVDHPPLVPLLARGIETLAGPSLVALRLATVGLGALIVFVAGLIAREMGGRAWAQGLAALAVAASPVFLLTNHLFQTVTPDQVVWVVCSWLVLHILRTGRERLWLLVGLICGVGLLAKYTVALFGLGLVAGLAATPWRRSFRSPWLWAGGAVAVALVLPNLFWQLHHGWPSAEFIVNRGARTAAELTPLTFLAIQLAFIGGISMPVFVAGLARLFGPDAGAARVLGWLWLVVTVLLTAIVAKPYYPAPTYPVVLAAGALWLEARGTTRGWRRLRVAIPLALVLGQVPLAWMVLPLVPRETFARHQDAWPHKEYREMFGWEELAAQVAAIYHALPADERGRAGLMTDSYGEAAALDLFGQAHGLPRATSAHNNYYYWGPPEADIVVVVAWSSERLAEVFDQVDEVRRVTNSLGVVNESAQQRIFVCRRPLRPWHEIWEVFRSFV